MALSPPQLLTFSLDPGAPAGATINLTNGVLLWTPTDQQLGTNLLTVTVTDNGLPPLSASQTFTVSVLPSNHPPVLAAISNQLIAVGMMLQLTNSATDLESPPQLLTFSLDPGAPDGASIDSTSGVLLWMPTAQQLGTNSFAVTVTDNGLPPLSASQTFTVSVLPSNQPPVLAAVSDQLIAVGMTLQLTNSAADLDSPPQLLTFTLDSGAPDGASIDPTNGVLLWTPNAEQLGTNSLTVTVTDNGLPPLSASQTFTVSVLPSNHPPVLAAVSNQLIAVGMTLQLTNSAADPDSPPQLLTFTLDPGAPDGASIDSTNGVLLWTPNNQQLGTNSLTVTVTDNGLPPLGASQTFTVSVLPSNHPPVLAAISNQLIAVGMTLQLTNSAADLDSPPQLLTYTVDPGAPDGVSIDSTNGVLLWTPNNQQLGTNSLTVTVTDNGLPPLGASQTFTVLVLPSNQPPVLTEVFDQTIPVGATLSMLLSATDLDSPPQVLTFSLETNAPAGAGIDPVTGLFTWTPTIDQVGSTEFRVVVTDDGLPPLSAYGNFSVRVFWRPQLDCTATDANQFTITWLGVSGQSYQLEYSDSLSEPVWAPLGTAFPGTGIPVTVTNDVAAPPLRFFRLKIVP